MVKPMKNYGVLWCPFLGLVGLTSSNAKPTSAQTLLIPRAGGNALDIFDSRFTPGDVQNNGSHDSENLSNAQSGFGHTTAWNAVFLEHPKIVEI